tara:strand:- start:513 stop:665 length:153 start_codon:yes stop_codon:yes gene_type:complete
MPSGKGTYGSKMGRPKKKVLKKAGMKKKVGKKPMKKKAGMKKMKMKRMSY